jgi:hyperosmotically inducible protein
MRSNTRFAFTKVALIGSLALALAGPASAASAPDAWVTTQIKMSLLTDESVTARDINVDTMDGRVTLHGQVPTAAEKARAEKVAREISGVREVRNLLQVVPARAREHAKVTDDVLKQRGDAALSGDKALSDSDIDVKSVNGGVVLLSGRAKTLSDAYRAVDDAARIDGVVRVASEIRSPDQMADEEMWREGGYDEAKYSSSAARDTWITTAVKMRLMANTETPAFDINVDTNDGVVTLFGVVESAAAKDQATAEARKVGGVRQVVNDLQVVAANRKDAVARNDDDVENAIEQRIEARDTLADDKIEVEVSDGVARLSGTVKTRSDQVTALTVARSTAGVRRVIDDLRLESPPVSLR